MAQKWTRKCPDLGAKSDIRKRSDLRSKFGHQPVISPIELTKSESENTSPLHDLGAFEASEWVRFWVRLVAGSGQVRDQK